MSDPQTIPAMRAPRVRRELRTLHEEERKAYFDAIKIMRNTSDASGVQKYGKHFRGYDYLSFKHAIATFHKCADQAHLPENVIVYHRAFLLEFELSLLAILRVNAPDANIEALPYWNWFIDIENDFVQGGKERSMQWEEAVEQGVLHLGTGQVLTLHMELSAAEDVWEFNTRNAFEACNFVEARRLHLSSGVFTLHMDRSRRYFGSGAAGLCAEGNRIMVIPKYRSGESDFLHSSLWQYWGSPYGNPADGMYTIHDPYFQSSVPTIRSATALNPNTADYVFEILGEGRWISNAFGFYRSPWSESNSTGLTRNPGWIFNSDDLFVLPDQSDECTFEADHASFAFCTAGSGVRDKRLNFGAHFAPHVFLGTFNDASYIGQSSILELQIILYSATVLLILILLRVVSFCCWAKRKVLCRTVETVIIGLFLFATAYCCLWSLPGAKLSTVGIKGAFEYDTILYEDYGIYKFGQREWRYGIYDCPVQKECVQSGRCQCTYRTRSWIGSRLLEIMPEPYPFTSSDYWSTSFSINENFFFSIHALYDMMHYVWAENQRDYPSQLNHFGEFPVNGTCAGTKLHDTISEEMCFTAEDTGLPIKPNNPQHSRRHVRSSGQPCLTHSDVLRATMQRDRPLYVYDRMYETYSWHVREPTERCPDVRTVCAAEANSIQRRGEVFCIRNAHPPVGFKKYQVESNETRCEVATGRRKPAPPTRLCNCQYERNRAAELTRRKTALSSHEDRWFWTGISFLLAAAVQAATMLYTFQNRSHSYTPLHTK